MYRWRRFTIRRALLYSHCDRTSRQIKIINLSSHIDTSSTTWPLSALTGNCHTDLLALAPTGGADADRQRGTCGQRGCGQACCAVKQVSQRRWHVK